ncbi:hypothetical protein Goshw_019563 [Gossypium schwendimanii]|uniref:Uncharacterized protein n=1 Tax=Gossypium schwendimanii TaxID=34291 RepID=A0A7J9MYW9_GOSSC|nr:hypothetical protein [Gossypium schwendimanii]
MAILQNLQDEDVEWRAPWMIPDENLYRCGDFDWVRLLEFEELLDMLLYSCPMITLEYSWWWGQRVNDNILVPNQEITRSLEEHLSIRTASLGKMSEQWRQEIKEEKIKVDQWEKKFQDT